MSHHKNPPGEDPFHCIHPMCAKSVDDFKTITEQDVMASPEWGIEEKYDGHRAILQWHPDGTFRATSRKVSVVTHHLTDNTDCVPQYKGLFTPPKGPTVLDGEFLHPTEAGSNAVGTILNSAPAKAIARQKELGDVKFVAFDILCLNGKWLTDQPFVKRRTILEEFQQRMVKRWPTFMSVSRIEWETQAKYAFLADIYARGGEGAMAKHKDGTYTDISHEGRRSSKVLKIKPFIEADVVLLNFIGGKGKYNTETYGSLSFGQWVAESVLNAMIAGTNKVAKSISPLYEPMESDGVRYIMVEMGTCSGFTQEQQAAFFAAPKEFIGEAIEVGFQGRFPKTGRMRHPQFRKTRHDKNPDLCIYEPPV